MPRVFAVIDLSSLMHRARHVVHASEDAETKAGMALAIVFQSLRKTTKTLGAEHLVFCIDAGSWRSTLYPAYKARRRLERSEMTQAEQQEAEVFFAAMTDLVNFLTERTKCTVLNLPGIEADDFVARWVQTHPQDQHVIVSGDSDFIQLLAPNVRIYDGINDRLIATDRVTDGAGKTLAFEVNPKSGKLKVEKPQIDFVPEPEWWRKALFLKIIRGDPGDGIFGAYPGVRYQGSSKSVGIADAWEDRVEQGYNWNNFMLKTWAKPIGLTESGDVLTKQVRVKDEYAFNQTLIDLTAQPDDIKTKMDVAIAEACRSKSVSGVGVYFLRFCGKHQLLRLSEDAASHAAYLNAGYPSHE